MRLWPLVCAALVAAMALSLAGALVTHDGVGPVEYVVGIALVALLALGSLRLGRQALRHA